MNSISSLRTAALNRPESAQMEKRVCWMCVQSELMCTQFGSHKHTQIKSILSQLVSLAQIIWCENYSQVKIPGHVLAFSTHENQFLRKIYSEAKKVSKMHI